MDEPIEVRALPDDPVARFRGRFKRAGIPTSAQMRAEDREDEIEEESAKQQRIDSKWSGLGRPSH
jgi:hypothetical protein